jgi:hypothetical protein
METGAGAGAGAKGKTSASKWFEHRLERGAEAGAFRLKIWNRLPWARSTLSLMTQDVGLKATGGKSANTDLLWLRVDEPAYRVPCEVRVTPKPDAVSVTVSRPLRLRLFYGALCPDWPRGPGAVLVARRPDGSTQDAGTAATWGNGFVEWSAAGDYEIRPAGR